MKRLSLICIAVFMFSLLTISNGFSHSFTFGDLYIQAYQTPAGGFNYGSNAGSLSLGNYKGTQSQSLFQTGGMGDANLLQLIQNSTNDYVFQFSNLNVTPYGFKDSDLDEPISGQWNVPSGEAALTYLIVKGATTFSIHEYDPAALAGLWDVGRLGTGGQMPAMSFVRGYKGSVSVPEPGTMFLLGVGLFGLAIGSRKKFIK